jgi:hypothetical protein
LFVARRFAPSGHKTFGGKELSGDFEIVSYSKENGLRLKMNLSFSEGAGRNFTYREEILFRAK